ncbi:MAG: hypothetical protein Q9181_002292 [Wetmoreana brouardii]
MSRVPNGSNGYINGDHGSNSANQYNSSYRDGEEQRPGGYGGFYSDENSRLLAPSSEQAPSAPLEAHRSGTNGVHVYSRHMPAMPSQGRWQNGSRSRERDGPQNASSLYGNGPGGRQIEDVLSHIHDKWHIMTVDECVPVHVTLQLMDHSSLGRGSDYQDFQRTSRHLQKALRSIVNEHHQGFNSSIGTFHKIQSSIQSAQVRVRSLKESVYYAKSSLMEVKPELQDLGASSQRYKSVLQILGQIEKLQTLPELLDAQIADKHFLAAIDILQGALRLIRKSEMESIGALSDLRIADDTPSELQKDSFRYIQMLLEALDRLGCLDVAVDRIEQRMPVELFTIVDKTNREVELRHPTHLRDTSRLDNVYLGRTLQDSKHNRDVLDDLLLALYSKFEAIAEGHRVVHDIVSGIARRNGLRHHGSLTGSFKELWKLYQSERVFQLEEIDSKATDFLTERDELDKILQNSVPGLVSKSQRRSGTQPSKDPVSKEGPATHKLLVGSSVFNISILLPPSLSFLQRLKDIVPPDSDIAISTLTSFLDDFLVNVFFPQFEESVTELCSSSCMDLDAFQEDQQWSQHAARPVLKSASQFFTLIKTFCGLLDTLPEDQNFTQLIISQLISYYDRCCKWYKSMVQRDSVPSQNETVLKPAAAMAAAGDLRDVLDLLWKSRSQEDSSLVQKEIEYLVSKTRETRLLPADIISSRGTVASLCLLYTSMVSCNPVPSEPGNFTFALQKFAYDMQQWLASGLTQLQRVVSPSEFLKRTSTRPQQVRRWTLLDLNRPYNDGEAVHLPMDQELATTFNGIITSMRSLALDALFTLQVDIRCGIAHMMMKMLDAPYLISYPTNNPDSKVLDLNLDLVNFDDALSTYLSLEEHRFITSGLATFVDTLLVAHASRIKAMDVNGCGRMQLNILVLQQNLKGVEGDVSLSRSSHFFELFAEGADSIVARVKETGGKDSGFTLEEWKVLVELCHSEGLQSAQRETSVQARRRLTEHLRQLEEYM